MSLSWRQTQVLDFIRACVNDRGYPPSVRELMTFTGLRSPASVWSVLHELEVKGWIRREPGKPRAIQVLDPEGAR